MADKIDLKKDLRDVYAAGREPALVDIPDMGFLMVDGRGDPNASPEYAEALAVLYAVAYKAKFTAKAAGHDFVVPPLQGLWWAAEMEAFATGDRPAWEWTMMIAVPDSVGDALVSEALSSLAASDPPPGLDRLRFERYDEGRVAQVMHIGPYAEETPTIERLHRFIDGEGLSRRGRHHEIYLGDPRRTAPEKLRTIIRQPVG